jgi:APA family basic amino acid/polyamine antiporter
MSEWNRRKTVGADDNAGHERLKPSLSWWHLVALGVGAIVGTGIYTLVGVGAGLAGPAVVISFLVAGAICACAALAYAEVATMIPASGSAYSYSYVAIGQLVAWVVGWSLILEYSLVVSAVAVGWSGYAVGFLGSIGIDLPHALVAGPHAGGVLNLPAIAIVGVVAGLLALGTRESATINAVLVVVKIAALALFLFVALPHFDSANFTPFMPYGFAATAGAGGVQHGVMAAAAIIFFAFYGFDAVSTAAEECKNPGRDLPIGIIGAMVVCTAIYIGVAAGAIGAAPYTVFADSPEPLALILRSLGGGQGRGPCRGGGDHRAADSDPGLPLRPEPHLLRHGSGRPVPRGTGQGQPADRHTRADHLPDRRDRRGPGGVGAAGRDRRPGQRRHLGGLCRRGLLPADHAPA